MKIQCAHAALVPIKELKKLFHPKNPNVHTDDQIARLAAILEYQGARKAATISKRSGLLIAGHGRIMAAEKAGWKQYPVDYQEYESDEQEFADLVADNAIAEWAALDLGGINAWVPELGPDFDIDLLGIKDFVLDVSENHALDEKPDKSKDECTHVLEVHLPTEKDMVEVYEDLLSRGFIVKYR